MLLKAGVFTATTCLQHGHLCVAYYFAPLRPLTFDVRSEILRRAARGRCAKLAQSLAHIGIFQNKIDLFLQAIIEVWRRAACTNPTRPGERILPWPNAF